MRPHRKSRVATYLASALLAFPLLATGCKRPAATPEVEEPAKPDTDAPIENIAPAVTPSAGEGSWTTFHGGRERAGRASVKAITTPRIRWKKRIGIQGWLNAPLIVGDTVIAPSSGSRHNSADSEDGVHAVALDDGAELWHAPFAGDANGVAYADGRVIATSDDGHIYALDGANGKQLWKARGEGKVYSHPLIIGDTAVVGDAGGWLRGLSVADGAEKWKVELRGPIRGGAAADATRIYAVSQGGLAIALSHAGEVQWRRELTRPDFDGVGEEPAEVYSPPVIVDGLLIVPFARDTTYENPALIALHADDGQVKWRSRASGGRGESWGNIRTTPTVVEGLLVYSEPYSGDVVGIAADVGTVRYRTTIDDCFFPQWGSPVAAGSQVYLPRFSGNLFALDGETGRVRWHLFLGDATRTGSSKSPRSSADCYWEVPAGSPLYAPPALAPDGTLIVGSGEGILYAIEEASGR